LPVTTLTALTLTVLCGALPLFAQQEKPRLDIQVPVQQLSLYAEYANDSSHIWLGGSGSRKLATLGAGYTFRSYANRAVAISYLVEVMPVMLESDPVLNSFVLNLTSPVPVTETIAAAPAFPVVNKHFQTIPIYYFNGVTQEQQGTLSAGQYGSRTTYGFGVMPVGYKFNLRPTRSWQPVAIVQSGFVISQRDIPVFDSSSFNFTFAAGIGLEHALPKGRSWTAEVRVHHLSNGYIATQGYQYSQQTIPLFPGQQLGGDIATPGNPGVDQISFHVSYNFKRR
jgi:hypothetical protein